MTLDSQITIPVYSSDHKLITSLRTLIETEFKELFNAVIVHGSIATNEIINYSDFDGVLIVKDNKRKDPRLDLFLKRSMKLIYNFDPLQHHSWFIVSESELLAYPESNLPQIVFEKSKLIFPTFPLTIKLISNTPNYKTNLINILNQFEKRNKNNWKPKNVFQLKGYLSQIMLLPSLYYAAINSQAINKSESFTRARAYFNETEWLPIIVASNIRQNWSYEMSFIQKQALKVTNPKFRRLARRYFAPKIDQRVQQTLDSEEFRDSLQVLLKKIRATI